MTAQPFMRSPFTSLLVAVLLLLAYVSPWVYSPVASLSPGAYDLAEWTSLHPAVRASWPPLLTTLLLRLPLACSAILLAFTPVRSAWARASVLALLGLLVLAQLPPVEFFLSDGVRADRNYQQQFALAVLTLVGGGIALILPPRPRRWQAYVVAWLALVGGIAALVGLLRGLALLRAYALPVQMGAGGVIFAILLGGVALLALVSQANGRAADQE